MNRAPSGDISAADASGLNSLLSAAALQPVDSATQVKFEQYLSLILRWNARMNLTAIRDPKEILSRHFVESIACARYLPVGITTLLDFGTGAGFPGIPIALCRPEIAVTLCESQTKKAAFLQEAVRALGLNSPVFAQRAEKLDKQFDAVTLRAVDRMEQAVAAASNLARPGGWLAVMTTEPELPLMKESAGSEFSWAAPRPFSGSDHRILALGSKSN